MNDLYNRYAYALLEYSKEENKISTIREELYLLSKTLKTNKEIIDLLDNKTIKIDEKFKIVENVFKKNFSNDLISYIKVIVRNNRSLYLYYIIKETLLLFNDYLNIEQGIIYSSIALTDEEINKIQNNIEVKISKKTQLINKIDTSLIGGIKVVLKNEIFDYSIQNQLKKLREKLLNGGK
ncbi:MAG: ATP synthase F1 subunit delta [Bacillales bacterium]